MSRIVTWIVALGVALSIPVLLAGTANAAPAGGWGPIITCESGGHNIANGSGSSASGYFQILDSTWTSHGGGQFSSRAMNTSFANQQIVAERVLADQGLGAWGPSRSCWAGKAGAPVKLSPVTHTGGKARPVALAAVKHSTPVHHYRHHRSHRHHHSHH